MNNHAACHLDETIFNLDDVEMTHDPEVVQLDLWDFEDTLYKSVTSQDNIPSPPALCRQNAFCLTWSELEKDDKKV